MFMYVNIPLFLYSHIFMFKCLYIYDKGVTTIFALVSGTGSGCTSEGLSVTGTDSLFPSFPVRTLLSLTEFLSVGLIIILLGLSSTVLTLLISLDMLVYNKEIQTITAKAINPKYLPYRFSFKITNPPNHIIN
jgi:hypothetical protein